MKKRIKLSTLIRRTLLSVLVIVVVAVLLVYFLDVYSPSSNSVYNKYQDEYWNNDVLEGFQYPDELKQNIVKWDQNDKTGAYVLPWKVDDPNREKDDLSITEIINSGRYYEEISRITQEIQEEYQSLTSDLAKWDFIVNWDANRSVKEWIEERLEVSEDEYLPYHPIAVAIDETLQKGKYGINVTLPTTITLEDHSVVTIEWSLKANQEATLDSGNQLHGIFNVDADGENEELVSKNISLNYKITYNSLTINASAKIKLRAQYNSSTKQYDSETGTSSSVNVGNEINVNQSAFEYATTSGFEGDLESLVSILKLEEKYENAMNKAGFDGEILTFIYFLSQDQTLYQQICSIGSDYVQLVNQQAEYYTYYELIQERLQTSYKWEDYYKNVLLGFGGLATDYPNQPVLSVDKSNGGKLEFWFNVYITTFKLVEKDANGNVIQTWLSNPDTEDTSATTAIKTAQKSILNLSYSVLKGQTDTYSTYEYSVSDTNIFNDVLTPNYAVNFDVQNNKVLVWYKLVKRGIDYSYFPKYISVEKWDEYMDRNAALAAEGAVASDGSTILDLRNDPKVKNDYVFISTTLYKKIEADDPNNQFGYAYYEYKDIQSMGNLARNDLYKYFYGWCNYTEEDLINDNNEFGQEVNISKPEYSIAIEYELNEKGLNVSVPGNSIKEDASYPLTTIDILPYFTATEKSIDGYTVIPDGSGAVLEHNNGKNFKKYQKRVYTTDLTNVSAINQGEFPDLMFPMYAVINQNNSGVLAYATSAAGQLQLTADISGRQDSYNVNYYTAYLRESTEIILGTASYDKKILVKWTDMKSTNDININYELLADDELNYSKVAKKYREILIEQYNITNKNDTTTSPTLNIDVLGSYTYKDNFLGIPYTAKDSLTTIDQLNEMIEKFKSFGIENINAFYLGWTTSGLVNKTFEKMKVSSLLGSKDKFKQLLNDSASGVTVYPYVSFSEFSKYYESFGNSHYTTHGVDGDRIIKYPYDLNSNVYDKKKDKIYVLSPRYYESFGQVLSTNFKKATNNYNAIAIENLGSGLSGDYRKNITTFKVDAIKNQIAVLDNLYQEGINNLTLYTPYDYAFKYTTVARNIPYETTKYEILDYSIPFYQLVVNGMFDYSSESINAESGKGTMEHVMRMIETGSNMMFTFSGDSSEKLIQTDYNTYYYTLYTDWLNEVESIYHTLDDLGIYQGELVSHEYLGNNVFKVVYATNNEDITIYLNYSRNSYTLPNGDVVEAKNYKKL